MKKLIPIVVIVVIAVVVVSWLGLSFQIKAKYDNLKNELSKYPIIASPIDSQFKEYLSEVEGKWVCKLNETNGPHSTALKALGLTPSVKNLIYLINYQMPEYSWFLQERNKEATKFAMFKGELSPAAMDKTIHVSADQKTAFIITKENIVLVFKDDSNGLRELIYHKNK
jgi:hypothetical protein